METPTLVTVGSTAPQITDTPEEVMERVAAKLAFLSDQIRPRGATLEEGISPEAQLGLYYLLAELENEVRGAVG